MSKIEKGQRITEFLDSGAWLIAPDRVVTRRAVFESLPRLPDFVLALVFADLHVLVVAPALGRVATAVPYLVQSGALPIRFSVIYLDARMEAYELGTARAVVSEAFSSAFATVAGIERPPSGLQHEPQASRELDQHGTPIPTIHSGRPN
jgi:hypothetical protein